MASQIFDPALTNRSISFVGYRQFLRTPLRWPQPGRWFHGSPLRLDRLAIGSTVTPIVEYLISPLTLALSP